MKLQLDKRFLNKTLGSFSEYVFEVGILDDKAYRKPVAKGYEKTVKRKKAGYSVTTTMTALRNFNGGPARRASRDVNGTVADVSKWNRLRYDYLREPFKNPKNKDVLKFTGAFLSLLKGKGQIRRLENALQAVVRNPIKRQDYGVNSVKTIKAKGFDRVMIDTGQLFQNIKARVKKLPAGSRRSWWR